MISGDSGFDFQLLERRRLAFDGAGNLYDCRFAGDNGQVHQLKHARLFAEQWPQMSSRGLGLLLWGPPGSGKTFAAACIANSFLESADPFAPSVIMTNFGVILRHTPACSPQEREEYIARLTDCGLLILDDFGMERQTDFAREQIFQLVNGRYLSGKPMILTTNLTLNQMKHHQTMAEQRIFDRILEKCVPVCFDGESLRRQKAEENMSFYRTLADCGNT